MSTVDGLADSPRQVRRAERPVTVKIATSEVDLLQALALLGETTLAQQIRLAVEEYLEWRLTRPNLAERVAAAQERQASVLAGLLNPDAAPAPESRSGGPAAQRPTRQKSVTLRIPNRECDLMTALGLLDNTTLADQLRSAVTRYVTDRLTDQSVSAQVHDVQQERERVLTATA
jgi:hypothetical protein